MQILDIKIQNYRNIQWAHLCLEGQRHFLLGPNGQGKTNLIEAIHLLTALKSFRQADTSALIQAEAHQAIVNYSINHPNWDTCPATLTISNKGKALTINEKKIAKFSDWIGAFPSTVMSSEDIQLLRGSPNARRRLLDSILSSTDGIYLNALKKYHALLAERNALLKKPGTTTALFSSFEKLLATEALVLIHKRTKAFPILEQLFIPLYQQLSQLDEVPRLQYLPNIEALGEAMLIEQWEKTRPRDLILKSTTSGPHRDDFSLELKSQTARHFASEGQQRSLVIALKLAQVKYLEQQTGQKPVILADDILGQLDPNRQKRFWNIIDDSYQLIATGTVPPPLQENWKIWEVLDGSYQLQEKVTAH